MKTYKATGLRPEILSALADAGLQSPTPIQAKTIPFLLKTKRDLLGLAPQGAGKTGAYGLPMLQRIDFAAAQLQGLILCSRREASLKITGELRKFAKNLPQIRVFAVHDNVDIQIQADDLRKRVHIVAATPDRCLELIRRGDLDLSHLRWLVIDDADVLMEQDFQKQVDGIIAQIPRGHRTLAFASSPSAKLDELVRKYLPEHETIDLLSAGKDAPAKPPKEDPSEDAEVETTESPAEKPATNARKPARKKPDGGGRSAKGPVTLPEGINHAFCLVPPRQRYYYLIELLQGSGDIYAVVFCRTRKRVHELTAKLGEDGIKALGIDEETPQKDAAALVDRFIKREVNFLVTNSIPENAAAIKGLTHLIHFNPPTGGAMYERRMALLQSGTRNKDSVLLLLENETPRLAELEERIGQKIEELRLDVKLPTSRKSIQRPGRDKKKGEEQERKSPRDKAPADNQKRDEGRNRNQGGRQDEDRGRNQSNRQDEDRNRNQSNRRDDNRSRNQSNRRDEDRSRNRSGRGDEDRSRNQSSRRENETPRSQALPRRMERVHESEIIEGPPASSKPKKLSSKDLADVIEAVRRIDPTRAGLEREWSAIYKKLEKLTWEEVIRHFVAYIVQSDAVQDMEEKEEPEATGLRAFFRFLGKKPNS